MDLKVEINGVTSTTPIPPAFRPDMTVAEALEVNDKASMVFAAFHLGGCSHCAVSTEETIEQVAMGYGVPMDQLMTALNSLEKTDQTSNDNNPNIK